MHPNKRETKDTTVTVKSSSYLVPLLEIGSKGKLLTKLYDKRDEISFKIVNFPFICGNILSAPAYSVHISNHTLCQNLPKLRKLFVLLLTTGL